MRSWSKAVIFSRSRKSSSSDPPRRPAFSEFWSSLILRPWFDVMASRGSTVSRLSDAVLAVSTAPCVEPSWPPPPWGGAKLSWVMELSGVLDIASRNG